MKLILDIDGVLVKTPGWVKPEILSDGFLKFDEKSTKNIISLISEFNASIVLISTHRINYTNLEWCNIFKNRGIDVEVKKINEVSSIYLIDKTFEIINWVNTNSDDYIVIDDDISLGSLPESIKAHWIKPSSLVGFSDALLNEARLIASKQKGQL